MNNKAHATTVALLFAIAAPAGAATISYCTEMIGVLRGQTIAAEFKNAKDESAEVAKLDDSKLKLNIAKLADAKQKIADYVTKLNQVNAAGKLDDPTGQTYMTLSNGAAGVTSCIDNIGK